MTSDMEDGVKIGFIGTGQVGSVLARRLGSRGHTVILAARDTSNTQVNQLAKLIGANAEVRSIKETISVSEIIFLATPWGAVESIVKENSAELRQKTIVDCTNPLKPDLSGLTRSADSSGGEYLQNLIPDSQIVKAFNTVGFNIMENPEMNGKKAVMYFCGNNRDAKFTTQSLIDELGFYSVDAGDIKSSGLLESFALLWISSAYKYGMGREFAFSVIKR